MSESKNQPQMTPERHLAAILTAFGECNAREFTDELIEALTAAEKDFDGVEDYPEEIGFVDRYLEGAQVISTFGGEEQIKRYIREPSAETPARQDTPTMVSRLQTMYTEEIASDGPVNTERLNLLLDAISIEKLREEVKKEAWGLDPDAPLWAGA